MNSKNKFEGLNELEGLQFIPVGKNKNPLPKEWQKVAKKHDLSSCPNVGLVCGKLSGNIEVIDFDLKYDLTKTLYEEFKKIVNQVDKELLKKMVVQKTISGGYHWIYRCSEIGGNDHLAMRPGTEGERKSDYDQSYLACLERGVSEAIARKTAQQAFDSSVRVLIETRGIGGQVVCDPSDGYKIVFGDLQSISEISPKERAVLFSIANSFWQKNPEVVEPPKSFKQPKPDKPNGKTPFDDYDERGDVVSLLELHGWSKVAKRGSKQIMIRPGATTSASSGNYDEKLNWFSVFSTSTEFQTNKGYRPYAVYAMLEHGGDFQKAVKALYESGYGDRWEEKQKTQQPSTRAVQSRINPDDTELAFLAKPEDYNGYLQQVRDGTLPMGLTTGSPEFDKNFLFKVGSLVSVNGIDNTGKTVFIWFLLMLAAMYHGWRGIIFASENSIGQCMRKMIQLYWGQPLVGYNQMSVRQEQVAREFIEKHFKFIKAQEALYNYKDILNMVTATRKKYGNQFNVGMIDPYNSLKLDLSGFSKLNSHEFHVEALSEIKIFGQNQGFGWFVNHHAYTGASRSKDAEKKYVVAPKKEDTALGQIVPAKSDDFLTVHRLTSHPTDWNITEAYVRKIKDTDTGGKVSTEGDPIRFEMYRSGSAFRERIAVGYGIDPIQNWHQRNGSQEYKMFDDQLFSKTLPPSLVDDEFDNEPF